MPPLESLDDDAVAGAATFASAAAPDLDEAVLRAVVERGIAAYLRRVPMVPAADVEAVMAAAAKQVARMQHELGSVTREQAAAERAAR